MVGGCRRGAGENLATVGTGRIRVLEVGREGGELMVSTPGRQEHRALVPEKGRARLKLHLCPMTVARFSCVTGVQVSGDVSTDVVCTSR